MLPELLRKSSVSRRALSKSIETGSIVDAGRSFCFRIPPGLRRWQLRNFVALGRMLAIQARSKKELVFIGKAAALLHELPVFGSLPHIDFSSGLSTHLVLPGGRAVSEGGDSIVFGSALARGHRRRPKATTKLEGSLCASSLQETCAQAAMNASGAQALAILDAALRTYIPQSVPRTRNVDGYAAIARQSIFEILNRNASTRGIRGARELLAIASPLCESPAESLAHYSAYLSGLEYVLQHKVWAVQKHFYLDLYFPKYGVAIEIDGFGKYVDLSKRTTQQTIDAEHSRQNLIQSGGIKVIRTNWNDLQDSNANARYFLQLCKQSGRPLRHTYTRATRALEHSW